MAGDQRDSEPGQASADEAIEGRPWWKVCCVGCLGLVILLLVGVFFLLRILPNAGPRSVRELPDDFPADLVLFRPEAAVEILYYPAEDKNRAFRYVTGPLSIFARGENAELPKQIEQGLVGVKDFDTVTVHWVNLNAKKDDVLRFYAGAMIQAGIADPQMREQKDGNELVEMLGLSERLNVKVFLNDDPETAVIDSVTVLVEYPSLDADE
jgi:hypothetical protein